ncbi:MAG: NAD(P)/FAD-dependent oxidoreductase [Actinomycetota bacterium]|nr:NAD(P)/FAD-dependent oxidoreductase [Actinomycetota bacterium]
MPASTNGSTPLPDHEVVVIGGGFSGIGAAIKLAEKGIEEFVVIEAGEDVGGAWHWNTYPGVAVDIPSPSYQFSFEQLPTWSRLYAPGTELKAYANHCVDKYGIRSKFRFNTKVNAATFDEESHVWHLETEAGEELTTRFVVGATGVFTQPRLPDIAGIGDFEGEMLHTARWDHDISLAGKRVGIIGTGASAVQVIPEIAPQVKHLTVFQRTPIWCLPKPDRSLGGPVQRALAKVPGGQGLTRLASQVFVEITFPWALHFHRFLPISAIGERIGRRFLRDEVHDPVVREKLTPRYAVGCKRPGFQNTYLATYNRENVHLETKPITEIAPHAVRTTDGAEHEIDILICATGFKVFEEGNIPPFPVSGVGGVDLGSWWDQNRYQAYQGVSVPGFPNFFSILGPYGYNGSSYFNLIENQSRHILRCIGRARSERATKVEVTAEANERYFKQMLSRRSWQILEQPSCALANSYYFDKHGDRPFRISPTLEVNWQSAHFDLDDYSFARLEPASA